MAIARIEPSKDVPPPFDTTDEEPVTFLEKMAVAGNTAEVQHALGAAMELDPDAVAEQAELLREVVEKRKGKHLTQLPVALGAAEFLREYGQALALDVASIRAAITAKLMEIANCGDTKHELKALELLGKHSDVGLFTERSEITINYKDPAELENAIKERVKRLLHADIIDVKPLGVDLDLELGVAGEDLPEIVENEEENTGDTLE